MILSIVVSLLKNMSSSTGFTKKAVAELATAMTNMHTIAKKSLNLFSLRVMSGRTKEKSQFSEKKQRKRISNIQQGIMNIEGEAPSSLHKF